MLFCGLTPFSFPLSFGIMAGKGGLTMDFKPIARMHSVFPTKFGVPRQSGLAAELNSLLVFGAWRASPMCG